MRIPYYNSDYINPDKELYRNSLYIYKLYNNNRIYVSIVIANSGVYNYYKPINIGIV